MAALAVFAVCAAVVAVLFFGMVLFRMVWRGVPSGFWCVGIAIALAQALPRCQRQRLVFGFEGVQIVLFQFFQIKQGIVGPLGGTNQLVQFDLDRLGIAVLGVLDQKNHQKRDDGGACVDDQLPGVAEAKQRPGEDPDGDHTNRQGEHPGATAKMGCRFGKAGVPGGRVHGVLTLVVETNSPNQLLAAALAANKAINRA